MKLFVFEGMLQVLNFEFLKLRILEIFRFTHDSWSLISHSKDSDQTDLSSSVPRLIWVLSFD